MAWLDNLVGTAKTAASDPFVINALAQTGAAISPQGSWQQMLGMAASKIAQDKAKGQQVVQGALGQQPPQGGLQPAAPVDPNIANAKKINSIAFDMATNAAPPPAEQPTAPAQEQTPVLPNYQVLPGASFGGAQPVNPTPALGGTFASQPQASEIPASAFPQATIAQPSAPIIPEVVPPGVATPVDNMTRMVAAGPQRVTNPLVGYVNPDPYTWAATGDPLGTMKTVLDIEQSRQNAQKQATEVYQQTVAGAKELSEAPYRRLQGDKIRAELTGELEKNKTRGEIAAKDEHLAMMVEKHKNTPLPPDAVRATGFTSFGQLYDAAGTTDPKLLNVLMDALMSADRGKESAAATIKAASIRAGADEKSATLAMIQLKSRDVENAQKELLKLAEFVQAPPNATVDDMMKLAIAKQKPITPQQVALAKAAEARIMSGTQDVAALYASIAPKGAGALRRDKVKEGAAKPAEQPRTTVAVARIPYNKDIAIPVVGMPGVASKIIEIDPKTGKRAVYFYNKEGVLVGADK